LPNQSWTTPLLKMFAYIADSVQCGYGRSGKFFSHDFAGIDADIYSMAKGMGNGFPIGGIIIAPKIKAKHFMLGTTFGGNHLACAAALAVLEVIEQESLMQNAATVGDYLQTALKAIPEISGVRGYGLMIGFDVPDSHKNLKKDLLSYLQSLHNTIATSCCPNITPLTSQCTASIISAFIFKKVCMSRCIYH
jgi:acetylornithine/succinyldiaminopimelate/putrescine aminotransferase